MSLLIPRSRFVKRLYNNNNNNNNTICIANIKSGDTEALEIQRRSLCLIYASETRTLLTANIWRLETFHMRCLRQLLYITWRNHITIEEILATTGLTPLQDILSKCRPSLFQVMMSPDSIQMFLHTKPYGYRRTFQLVGSPTSDGDGPPGQPRKTWCSQIWTDVGMSSRN